MNTRRSRRVRRLMPWDGPNPLSASSARRMHRQQIKAARARLQLFEAALAFVKDQVASERNNLRLMLREVRS